MKVKKLVIGIKSVDEVMTDFARAAKALERGDMVKCLASQTDIAETCFPFP